MIAAVAVVSFPSTIQSLERLSSMGLGEITPPLTETASFLDRAARPGEVVVTRRNEAVLALTKLRIPVYLRFSDYLISRDVVVARARDIDDFWRSWGAGTVRDDILRRYGVDWIVASRSETPVVLGGLPPALLGKLEIRQEFTNREVIIFRVRAV